MRLLSLAILAVLLTGCATSSPGTGTAWTVSVKHPFPQQNGSACADDPSVAFGLMSADMPSSSLSLTLHPEATSADAARIAGCLFGSLWSGAISVHQPA